MRLGRAAWPKLGVFPKLDTNSLYYGRRSLLLALAREALEAIFSTNVKQLELERLHLRHRVTVASTVCCMK
jgi:hypothetical protein